MSRHRAGNVIVEEATRAKRAQADASGSGSTEALGKQVRRGVAWTSFSRVLIQVLQLAVSVVLARLLLPQDFGAVAVVTTVTGFAALFVDLGLAAAIVQRPTLNEAFLSTAFWLNAVLGLVVAVPVVLLAPLFAGWFDAPDLRTLLPVASLNFVLSLGVVQSGLLRRALDFKRVSSLAIVNTLVTSAMSMVCAAIGLGPMSLVLGSVAGTLSSTIQLWIYKPWRPRARPDVASARALWAYTRGLLGFGVVNYWSRNADNLLVGRFLGVTALGFYGRAYNLMLMPVSQMSAVISAVLFPTLTRVQHQPERFARTWLLSTKASWVLGAPIGIGMAVTAPALVETLYGTRWLPMAPVVALLAASVPAQLIGSNIGAVFQARGRTGLQFRLGLVTSGVTIAAIAVALPFGIEAVAAALLIKSWVMLWVPLVPALRLSELRIRTLLGTLAYSGAVVVIMGASAYSPRLFMGGQTAPAVLCVQVVLGVLVYGTLFLAGERAFIRELRGRRRS